MAESCHRAVRCSSTFYFLYRDSPLRPPCGRNRFLLRPLLAGRDERCNAVVQLLQALVPHVYHVSRLVPVVLDVLCQRLWNREMFVFVFGGEERRRQVE